MLNIVRQSATEFELLTVLQTGWDFKPVQLTRQEKFSQANLIQAGQVSLTEFRLNVTYDQRLRARQGFYTFGILHPDCSAAWYGSQTIPSNALMIFPKEDDLAAISHEGFHGNGIHFRASYLDTLAQDLYGIQLDRHLPRAGIIELPPATLSALRETIQSWKEMERYQGFLQPTALVEQQDMLAISVLDSLTLGTRTDYDCSRKGDVSFNRALEFIHNNREDSITAAELCRQAGCSQRWLEQSFRKRFGMTPKKYIKSLRLARVREQLLKADKQQKSSIIEVASDQGFWHMGQFAADYRRLFGELPSVTLKRFNS